MDGGVILGGTYEKSIAVNDDGIQLIDRVSSMPITSHQFSLNIGANVFGNLADVGGILSDSTTRVGAPTNPFTNFLYQILTFIP